MAGGEPGALGRQWIERADGTVQQVGGRDSVEVQAGDVFVVETPGGGGYGEPG
jgi:5-oxoprolinase (ATP-hydrolysing)